MAEKVIGNDAAVKLIEKIDETYARRKAYAADSCAKAQSLKNTAGIQGLGHNKWLFYKYTSKYNKANDANNVQLIYNRDDLLSMIPDEVTLVDDLPTSALPMGDRYHGYYRTYVYCQQDETWSTSFYTDDPGELWVNGTRILVRTNFGSQSVAINFKAGWNCVECTFSEKAGDDGAGFTTKITDSHTINAYPTEDKVNVEDGLYWADQALTTVPKIDKTPTFKGVYANNHANSSASFWWNKAGQYWGGVGYRKLQYGKDYEYSNHNYFGPSSSDGSWVDADTEFWDFRGNGTFFRYIDSAQSTINSNVYALTVGCRRGGEVSSGYVPGISFNHLLDWNSDNSSHAHPQAWIGTKIYDRPGSERAYLVFATKDTSDNGSGDVPKERMSIDPFGIVRITSPTNYNELRILGQHEDCGTGVQDGEDRPSLKILGHYPQIVLMSKAINNSGHGATISLGAFNTANNSETAFKKWTLGTPGFNATFLDFGYSENGSDGWPEATNPHSGINNWKGKTIMRLTNDGKVHASVFKGNLDGKVLGTVCRGDYGAINSQLWNTIRNGKKDQDTNKMRWFSIYNDGAPETYGDILEFTDYYYNHWQPQLFLGGGKSGGIYYRNKDYNDDSWGAWQKLLTDSRAICVPFPGGGYYTSDASSLTGAIRIGLPQYKSNTMLRMVVDIYNYTNGGTVTYIIGGYNYNDSTSWHSYSAVSCGPSGSSVVGLPVRFCTDSSKNYIYIGNASTTWSYLKVSIRDVMVGYSNYEYNKWNSGWTIAVVDSITDEEWSVTNTLMAANGLQYNGWWTGGSGQHVNNANGMIFAYNNHGLPGLWGTVTTLECTPNANYKLQLYGEGYHNDLYFRNASSEAGGWQNWKRVITERNDLQNATPYDAIRIFGGSDIKIGGKNGIELFSNDGEDLYDSTESNSSYFTLGTSTSKWYATSSIHITSGNTLHMFANRGNGGSLLLESDTTRWYNPGNGYIEMPSDGAVEIWGRGQCYFHGDGGLNLAGASGNQINLDGFGNVYVHSHNKKRMTFTSGEVKIYNNKVSVDSTSNVARSRWFTNTSETWSGKTGRSFDSLGMIHETTGGMLVSSTGKMYLDTAAGVSIRAGSNTNNYNEGLRIHSDTGWTALMLMGRDNTGDSGTSAKSWGLFNHEGSFYLAKNGSSNGWPMFWSDDEYWHFRCRSSDHYVLDLQSAGPECSISYQAPGYTSWVVGRGTGSIGSDFGWWNGSYNAMKLTTNGILRLSNSGSSAYVASFAYGTASTTVVEWQAKHPTITGAVMTYNGDESGSITINGDSMYVCHPCDGGWINFYDEDISYDGSYRLRINNNGSFSTSDIRLKDDIRNIDINALDVINNLSLFTYRFNIYDDILQKTQAEYDKSAQPSESLTKKFNRLERKAKQRFIGMSAQQVEELTGPYSKFFVDIDEQGVYHLNESKLNIIALKAIKEQQQIINEQSKTIDELNNKLSKIEKMLEVILNGNNME